MTNDKDMFALLDSSSYLLPSPQPTRFFLFRLLRSLNARTNSPQCPLINLDLTIDLQLAVDQSKSMSFSPLSIWSVCNIGL